MVVWTVVVARSFGRSAVPVGGRLVAVSLLMVSAAAARTLVAAGASGWAAAGRVVPLVAGLCGLAAASPAGADVRRGMVVALGRLEVSGGQIVVSATFLESPPIRVGM